MCMVHRSGAVFLKSWCVLFLVLGLTSQAFAQTSACSLQGTVTDESTSFAIPGAHITAQGISTITETATTSLGTTATITTTITITAMTITDSNGDYCFGDLSTGTYEVAASADGYIMQTVPDVVIGEGTTTTQDFTLTPTTKPPTIKEVDIDFEPETLNTNNTSKDAVVTVKVHPPDGYIAEDFIPESVIIADIGGNTTNIKPIKWDMENDDDDDNDSHDMYKSGGDDDDNDDDNDNSKLVLKYNRQEVLDVIRLYQLTGTVEITVTGRLTDNTPIIGSDDVTVKTKK